MSVSSGLGFIGMLAISLTLLILARLSWRLGKVTHARPYFLGLYFAAFLFATGVLLRFLFVTEQAFQGFAGDNLLIILLVNGLPAFAITIALLVMWFYWSWLLAERD